MNVIEDDGSFKSVRKNFLAINILVFFLFLTKPDIENIKLLNISINISGSQFYTVIWIGYFYYAIRFFQEMRIEWKEFVFGYRRFYLEENKQRIYNEIEFSIKKICARVSSGTIENFQVMDKAILLENNVEVKTGENNIVTSMWTISYRIDREQIILLDLNHDIVKKKKIIEAIVKHFDDLMLTKIAFMQKDLFASKNKQKIMFIKVSNFIGFVIKNKLFLYAILPIILSIIIFLYAFFNSNWWVELYNLLTVI
ncbi:hypothetical protein ABW636_14085 [Aquimarina sp. 2201CG1-2-11]|uniref:hypothetical protein n=1 Tax=Aquimarina discodermiae TaxID=3231043 RepID=UPI00346234A0